MSVQANASSRLQRGGKAPLQAIASAFDVEQIRADFPILHVVVNGRPLVYLDNAATSQKPESVIQAMVHYYRHDNANIHRGVHLLSQRATEEYESVRGKVQGFLGAREAREIVFVRGATEAINLVAQTYGREHIGAGDEVLITAMEHHSNIVPWQMLCQQKGATLYVAPINDRGELEIQEFERFVESANKSWSCGHATYRTALGTINPVKWIVRLAHAINIPVLVGRSAVRAPHQTRRCAGS